MSRILLVRGAFTTLLCLVLAASGAAGQARPSPVGFWTTIGDDGRPTAAIEIFERDGALFGVVRALLVPATHDDSLCTRCSGALRNHPVVGLEILRDMRSHGDEWSGGEILDPENGRTYRASIHLDAGGLRLLVRGYIGAPLFGRSETWFRRTSEAQPLR